MFKLGHDRRHGAQVLRKIKIKIKMLPCMAGLEEDQDQDHDHDPGLEEDRSFSLGPPKFKAKRRPHCGMSR